jgi:hypothetical protein
VKGETYESQIGSGLMESVSQTMTLPTHWATGRSPSLIVHTKKQFILISSSLSGGCFLLREQQSNQLFLLTCYVYNIPTV